MAEFPRRHAPATVRLKELIATRLGKPNLLFCHQRRATHKLNGKADTSFVKRDLLEMVDWCRYVVGKEPQSVVGVCHDANESSLQYRMLNIDFSNGTRIGPIAEVSCGRYLPETWDEAINFRPPAQLQVNCEKGVAFVDLPSNIVWFDEAGRHMESLESERPVGEQLLAIFHRAVTSLVRRMGDLEDAYQALSVVQKAEQSSDEGRRIEL